MPLVCPRSLKINPDSHFPFAGESPSTLGLLHVQVGQLTAMTRFAMVSWRSSDIIHTQLPLKHFGLGFGVSMSSACIFQGNSELDAMLIVFCLFFRCLLSIFNDIDTMLPHQQSFDQVCANVFKSIFHSLILLWLNY